MCNLLIREDDGPVYEVHEVGFRAVTLFFKQRALAVHLIAAFVLVVLLADGAVWCAELVDHNLETFWMGDLGKEVVILVQVVVENDVVVTLKRVVERYDVGDLSGCRKHELEGVVLAQVIRHVI